jgi:hypothetical protein
MEGDLCTEMAECAASSGKALMVEATFAAVQRPDREDHER